MNRYRVHTCLLMLGLLLFPLAAGANPARDAILGRLAAQAKAANATFAGFSAERGKAFFETKRTGGKPDQPSCTACHTASPRQPGKTRAGKAIAPMAVSVTANRFTSEEKVGLWFKRNCVGVVGRECTPQEKGDFLTYMISQ